MIKNQLINGSDPLPDAVIRENIREIRERIGEAALNAGRSPQDITLMAVTKTVPPQAVNVALEEGVPLLGENRAQELLGKYDFYQTGAEAIHFIGHLQTNKVRQIIDKVSAVQSLDSYDLAQELEKQAAKRERQLDVLLEINIGEELSKGGISPGKCEEFVKRMEDFPHLTLRGLMAIPPKGKNSVFFAKMQQLFVDIITKKRDNNTINILSMGMSSDYQEAIQYGATLVRIGTAMFGRRNY